MIPIDGRQSIKPLHLHQPFLKDKYGAISRVLCTPATASGTTPDLKVVEGSSGSNSPNQQEKNSCSIGKQGPSVGKPSIGGPFNLIDHNGKSVTEKAFRGNWSMIYFGFTHCPDICPEELQKLASAIDKISTTFYSNMFRDINNCSDVIRTKSIILTEKKSGIKVVPIFISVDPERDTVEQVREYLNEFHPDLIGLTGSLEEIRKAARAYRVYYMKTGGRYLMDPNMEFVNFFGKKYDVDTLTDGVINEIKLYRRVGA